MDRRTFLTLLSLPAVAALLEACSSDLSSGPVTTGTGPTTGQARSSLTRVAAAPSEAPAAALAFNDFGAELYRTLAADDATGNLVMSPASIALALLMASAGARGETLGQMLEGLHVGDPDGIHRATNALTADLERRNTSDVTVSIANSLWGQSGFAFESAFLDLLATEYGAGMNLVDYRADPEAARVSINEWVAEETRDRIPELIGEDVITPDWRLALVNAIYMKAPWDDPFNEEATSPITFTTAAGSEVEVPAMRTQRFMSYSRGAGWQAIELPYVDFGLAMTVLVPDAGALAELEAALPISTAVDSFESKEVVLALPKWDTASSFSLRDALEKLGMTLPFSDDADFTGMTAEEPLHVGAVIHRANITVDEQGTEAAAATVIGMEAGSAPPEEEPIELRIDRPFLFAVRDTVSSAILFMGRVADPS